MSLVFFRTGCMCHGPGPSTCKPGCVLGMEKVPWERMRTSEEGGEHSHLLREQHRPVGTLPGVYVDLVSGSQSVGLVQRITLLLGNSYVMHAEGLPPGDFFQFTSICLMVSGDFLRFWYFIDTKLSF